MIYSFTGVLQPWFESWVRYYDGIVDIAEHYIYIPIENTTSFEMLLMMIGE